MPCQSYVALIGVSLTNGDAGKPFYRGLFCATHAFACLVKFAKGFLIFRDRITATPYNASEEDTVAELMLHAVRQGKDRPG